MKELINNMEEHLLAPFLPNDAKVLMLGSFPPQSKKWSMNFYYPNFQNDMWRIFGIVFFEDKEYFLSNSKKSFDKDKIIKFLEMTKIAISDSAKKICRRENNAADKHLEVIESLDWDVILDQIPQCKAIITTGKKSTEILNHFLQLSHLPKIGKSVNFEYKNREMILYQAPSSSRAYPKSVVDKAQMYKEIFDKILK